MASNLKQWEPIDSSETDALEKELKGRASEFIKLKVGKNRVRFLPKIAGMSSHLKVIHEHFVDDVPGKDGIFRFACPRRHGPKGARCPECEHADALRRSGNVVDSERARDHYPATRTYANVIDRSDEGRGPKVLTFGSTIFDELKRIQNDKVDGGDYTDPTDSGFDLIITRTGTGKQDTRYAVQPARATSALSDDEAEAEGWIESQWSLDQYASVLAADALAEALAGESGRARPALPAGRGRRAQDEIEDPF